MRAEPILPGELAVVGLGSNLGDSVAFIHQALSRLRGHAPTGFRASSLWRSSPVDCPPGSPSFVNAVCLFTPQPLETPESLLVMLQAIERAFGRSPKVIHHEPRSLDLDLLAFGSQERSSHSLSLPHPRAHQRRFVLEPLNEIAPDLQFPGWAAPACRLLAELRTGDQEIVTRLGAPA